MRTLFLGLTSIFTDFESFSIGNPTTGGSKFGGYPTPPLWTNSVTWVFAWLPSPTFTYLSCYRSGLMKRFCENCLSAGLNVLQRLHVGRSRREREKEEMKGKRRNEEKKKKWREKEEMKGNIKYKNFSQLVREGKPEHKWEKKKNICLKGCWKKLIDNGTLVRQAICK